jgi:hypothetical protein
MGPGRAMTMPIGPVPSRIVSTSTEDEDDEPRPLDPGSGNAYRESVSE